MQQRDIHHFLLRYFEGTNCQILNQTAGSLAVQLTIEMDKQLMNRPFYWHYLEKTGGTPNPMRVAFVTDPDQAGEQKGEHVHFGSPRLHQIFRSVNTMGGHIRLYEEAKSNQGTSPLHPWLGMNVRISYQSNRRKEELLSIGLNLIHGAVCLKFHDVLQERSMTPVLPDYCFTLSPLITLESGIKRIERYIEEHINTQSFEWAEEAIGFMNEGISLLETFYEAVDEKPECYYTEKESIRELYEPNIHVEVVNGGLFYLHPQFTK
ncbi:YqhG family protein [Bacillus tianshenii]|nr:YqhG family protein [Bacillus tianshenii]